MYTIVTAFFDIGRHSWKDYTRANDYYLNRAKRVCTLDNNMVFFVEPTWVDFIADQRANYLDKTEIIPLKIEDLAYYAYRDRIEEIMLSSSFKEDLNDPLCPEFTQPLYNVVTWSKISLIVKAIEKNPFKTKHFGWIDFGMSPGILKEQHLYKPLYTHIPNKIKLLCMRYPSKADLNIEKFYKSHTNRFAATALTGNSENFKLLNRYFHEEIEICLNHHLVASEQSILATTFVKHPELFDLYFGYWGELFDNYYEVTLNLAAVIDIALNCKMQGNIKAYEEVLSHIKKYDPVMWSH